MPPPKRPRSDAGGHCDSTPTQAPLPNPASPPRTNHGHDGAKQTTNREQEPGHPFVERFPIPTAGAPISDKKMGRKLTKEDLHDYLASCGPLGDQEKFELAELSMTTGLTADGRTRWLNASLLRKRKKIWKNSRALLKDIDRLPYGPKWTTEKIPIGEGDYRRVYTLFRRDILAVIRDLIGDVRFKHFMKYSPERHWTSGEQNCRVYGEMWTGNWWWRMQYLIRDPNGTVVPLIIASDKTTLSTMCGGQQAYPVYLTIGNISKGIRRKASKRATVILGYLPVDNFKHVENKALRKRLCADLLHRSMEKIFEPLKTASRDGVPMWCADGRLRRVYPVLAAYVADWPEQNDVSGTIQSGCPACGVPFHGRGSGAMDAPLRDHAETVAAFKEYAETGSKQALRQLKLRQCVPFWIDLPHVDFPACITPDILHQLHKGIFKDYVADWTEGVLGENGLNARFMAMPQAKDLRQFKKGITSVQQWTGRETKEMAKQFLPIIAEDPNVPDDFVKLVRALLDFLYLAQSAELSDRELEEMEEALRTFHRLKKILVELDLIADLDKFDDIPKFHMVGHYPPSTRELGTPDGYNTETPEHLHIPYAKVPWRASNRREARKQIVDYIRRLEAIRIHRALMDEYFGESAPPDNVCDDDDDDDDDDEESIQGDAVEAETVEDESEIAYPRPTLSVAVRPTCPRVAGHHLVSTYGATDLIRLLTRLLKPLARKAGLNGLVLPSDRFDTWHKLTIRHQPLPFAPNEPPQRDAVRVRPPTLDESGRKTPGLFDTVMFVNNPQAVGVQRYRVGRVRAIFTLPPQLRPLYSGHLVYLDSFTPFKRSTSSVHGMYGVSHDFSGGMRRGIIVPMEQVAMACHLGPRFSTIDPNVRLHSEIDVHSLCRHFYLNPFYNFFSYLFFRYWSHIAHS
ncbi:hypothetical protein FRC08_004668 [Ceratobasidium sp. 394]|nr:hypothetical protein FRC08_004668 [Ceratobasidium sp. 394]